MTRKNGLCAFIGTLFFIALLILNVSCGGSSNDGDDGGTGTGGDAIGVWDSSAWDSEDTWDE